MNVEYLREQTGNYMVIQGTKQTDCYEMKMCECNDIPGLLPLTIQRMDNCSSYMYRISNKVSLAQFYERSSPRAEEITLLLNSLKEVLIALGEYLLRPDGLLLEADHIFVDNNSHKVLFAYYENEESNGDFFANLKRLFEECVLQTVDHSDNYAVTMVYGTYKRLCGNNCTIQGLFETTETEQQEYSFSTKERVEPSILPEKVTEETEVKDRTKIGAIYGAFGLMAVLFLICLLSCFLPGMRIPSFGSALYGFFCLVIAVGAFLLYRWFKENQTLFIKIAKKETVIPYATEQVKIEVPKRENTVEEGTMILNLEAQNNVPLLRWKEQGVTKEWPIYQETVIGSSAEKADCVIALPGVSRLHAKIVCMPDHSGFFLKDLNSSNGSYLEDSHVPLAPFQLAQLSDNSKFRLGNVIVEFINH